MPRIVKGWHSFTRTSCVSSASGMNHTRPLFSQPQLLFICRLRRDGRLSRPCCEVAPAEIRTRNLPIANPVLYYTAIGWRGLRCSAVKKLRKQWRQRVSNIGGTTFPFPFSPHLHSLPLPTLPPPPPSPPLPLEVDPLIQLGGLGSAVSSPSGFWGGAPADIEFGAF